MKPFDLNRAIAGDPIETRCGVPIEFVAYATGIQGAFKVIGIMAGSIKTWRMDGTYSFDVGISEFDLVMKPILVKKWINIYKLSDGEYETILYDNGKEAMKGAELHSSNFIKMIETDILE